MTGTTSDAANGRYTSPTPTFELEPALDVVDTQVHGFNGLGSAPPGTPGRPLDLPALLSAMDALGVTSVIIDEYWGPDAHGNTLPGHTVPGGFRPTSPGAEMAALLHPGRFGILLRVNHSDPAVDAVLTAFAAKPGALAIRLDARTPAQVAAMADGAFDHCFAAAQRLGLTVCLLSYGMAPLLAPYLKRYPDVTVVVDHCGLVGIDPPGILQDRQPGVPAPPPPCSFEDLLTLAGEHANLALKWVHGPRVFSEPTYPFVRTAEHLVRAVEAFGRERVAWGSDTTAVAPGFYTWAQAQFYVRHAAGLSAEDREWVLGRSARTLFPWPSAPAARSH
jgi:predicted TIM-barrel fold metal-dependent hydrolase